MKTLTMTLAIDVESDGPEQAAQDREMMIRFQIELEEAARKKLAVFEKSGRKIGYARVVQGDYWNDVRYRLPDVKPGEESEPVIATDGKSIHVAYLRQSFDDSEPPYWVEQGRDGYLLPGTTHWKPLPSLPQ